MSRRGGIIEVAADGVIFDAKGGYTYSLGLPKREGILGADRPHGYKETPQLAFIEGEITDSSEIDLKALQTMTNATVTLRLANGKTIELRQAYYAHEGIGNTEEGNIPVRFETENEGEEIT